MISESGIVLLVMVWLLSLLIVGRFSYTLGQRDEIGRELKRRLVKKVINK